MRRINSFAVPRALLLVVANAILIQSNWAFAATPPASPQYRLDDLGAVTFSVGGAKDINDAGQISLNLAGLGYIYQNGNLSPAGGLTNNNASFGISSNGQLAWATNSLAQYWNGATQFTLPTLEPGGFTVGEDVNRSGLVVGYSRRSSISQYRGFVWNGTTMTDLSSLVAGKDSRAHAINDAGVIAGESVELPVRWVNGQIETLPLPTNTNKGIIFDISQNGNLAGYTVTTGTTANKATIWINDSPVVLPNFSFENRSYANDVNDRGDAVGLATSTGVSGGTPFFYTNGNLYELGQLTAVPAGWQWKEAYAINNGGQIVGNAYLFGQEHAFLLTPIPEPSSVLLAVLVFVALQFSRRR